MLHDTAHEYWEWKRKRDAEREAHAANPDTISKNAQAEEFGNARLNLIRGVIELGAYPEFKASLHKLPIIAPQEVVAQRAEWLNFWQAYCFIVRLPIAESVL